MVFPVGQQLKRPTRKGNYFFWKGDQTHSCNADMLVCAPKGNWGSKWNPEKMEPPQTCLLPVAWCFFLLRFCINSGVLFLKLTAQSLCNSKVLQTGDGTWRCCVLVLLMKSFTERPASKIRRKVLKTCKALNYLKWRTIMWKCAWPKMTKYLKAANPQGPRLHARGGLSAA